MAKRCFPVIFIPLLISLLFTSGSPGPVVAQQEAQPACLIDIPGVGWIGEARESDWGTLLKPNKITIYVRHQGPGRDKWAEPKEPDAIIVTLPHDWQPEAADQLLLPALKEAFSNSDGRNIHIIIDENVTLIGHLFGLPKPEEDEWAGAVVGYVTAHRNASFMVVLAEGSRGTVTNHYITDFSPINRIIIMSPRGDKSLDFISQNSNLPPIYIVTGLSDAFSWRWTQRLGSILRNNPNVHILQLQDLAGLKKTHDREQNPTYEGTWKVMEGGPNVESKVVKGSLKDLLPPLSMQDNPSARTTSQPSGGQAPFPYRPSTPEYYPRMEPPPFPTDDGGGGGGASDLGGVDFSDVQLRYLAEYNDSLGFAFRAALSQTAGITDPQQVGDLAWDSLFVWLALPSDTFWVNLNPNEPERIIDGQLGQTDAGRIMLAADLQLKKDTAQLTHPDSARGQEFWNRLNDCAAGDQPSSGEEGSKIALNFRTWIVPKEATVFADDNQIYIVDAPLDVKLESEYAEISGGDDGAQTSEFQRCGEALLKELVLPELVSNVNKAPEYRELREVFYSRVLAEWHKAQQQGKPSLFDELIEKGDIEPFRSAEPWSPKEFYDRYLKCVTPSETERECGYNVTVRNESREGDVIIAEELHYVSGGVDFTKVPTVRISWEELLARQPKVEERLADAMLIGTYPGANEQWIGGISLVAEPGTELSDGDGDDGGAPSALEGNNGSVVDDLDNDNDGNEGHIWLVLGGLVIVLLAGAGLAYLLVVRRPARDDFADPPYDEW